jgi:hypothetical protein
LHAADILIKVSIVEDLNLSDCSVARIYLLLQLCDFGVFFQDDIVALLAFPEQLHYSSCQSIEIVKHYESVDVLQGFLSISVHRFWLVRLPKRLGDQLMNPLGG